MLQPNEIKQCATSSNTGEWDRVRKSAGILNTKDDDGIDRDGWGRVAVRWELGFSMRNDHSLGRQEVTPRKNPDTVA